MATTFCHSERSEESICLFYNRIDFSRSLEMTKIQLFRYFSANRNFLNLNFIFVSKKDLLSFQIPCVEQFLICLF